MAKAKVSAKLVLKAAPNNLKVSKQFMDQVGMIMVDDMINGIKAQKQLDNVPLKKNATSTIKAKKDKGIPPLSLIAEGHHLVTRSTYLVRTTVNKASVTLAGVWSKIVGYLYNKGYTGFWGIGPRAGGKIMKLYKAEMIRLITGKK